jgi:hypothetical protein
VRTYAPREQRFLTAAELHRRALASGERTELALTALLEDHLFP